MKENIRRTSVFHTWKWQHAKWFLNVTEIMLVDTTHLEDCPEQPHYFLLCEHHLINPADFINPFDNWTFCIDQSWDLPLLGEMNQKLNEISSEEIGFYFYYRMTWCCCMRDPICRREGSSSCRRMKCWSNEWSSEGSDDVTKTVCLVMFLLNGNAGQVVQSRSVQQTEDLSSNIESRQSYL